MRKILILGAAYAELTAYVEKLPEANEEIHTEKTEMKPGGNGFLSARILQELSLPYELIAPVGSGTYGDHVREEMRRAGMAEPVSRDEISGCVYSLKDPAGKTGVFRVPGTEFDYSPDDTAYIDNDELKAILCFGDFLSGEGAYDLVDFLSYAECPVYFVPGSCGSEADKDLLEGILSLKPVLCLSEEEASLFTEVSDDASGALKDLQKKTGSDVLLFTKKNGILFSDGRETIQAPYAGERLLLGETDLVRRTVLYLAARSSGVDLRNSLMFSDSFEDENDYEEVRQRLVRMITLKA